MDCMSRFYLALSSFFSIVDNSLEVYSVPGNSQIAIEQMCGFLKNIYIYELPIFAIQNFVNMQISFIGLLQVF